MERVGGSFAHAEEIRSEPRVIQAAAERMLQMHSMLRIDLNSCEISLGLEPCR